MERDRKVTKMIKLSLAAMAQFNVLQGGGA